MISILIGMGIFGLSGLSWLCPLLAYPVFFSQRRILRTKPPPTHSNSSLFRTLDILIPAHNEAEFIGTTLRSIQQSIDHFRCQLSLPPMKINIHIGADCCTDKTTQIAAQFPLVSVSEFPDNRSKWVTMNALVAASSANWIILVDAGTVWPKNFVTDFVREVHAQPEALAIAPSYKPLRAGWLPQILWHTETLLKKMESFCGGPISLHGATVGYQTTPLKKALADLGDTLWLNDDVVIPLKLRTLYPEGIIIYPIGIVRDAAVRHDQLDIGRRKRMVLGNLQWVTGLLPDCLSTNPVAGIVAMRRLFRIFWAYWLACFVIGLALAFHILLLPTAACIGIMLAFSGSVRQMAGAGLNSFLAPFRMARPNWQLEGSWK